MKPKHHLLLHYPTIMRKYGPVVNQWTIRFKGKHKSFKEIAKSAKSRVDVCKTIANRYVSEIKLDEKLVGKTMKIFDFRDFGDDGTGLFFSWFKLHEKIRIRDVIAEYKDNETEPLFYEIVYIKKIQKMK